MIPLIIVAISGLSGIEGLFFARESAEAKGFEVGSNYQRQSAIDLLSYAVIAVLIWFIKWGIKAELTIFMAFIFFILFFSIEPLYAASMYAARNWQPDLLLCLSRQDFPVQCPVNGKSFNGPLEFSLV